MTAHMELNYRSPTTVARPLNQSGSEGKKGGRWQSSGVIRAAYNDFHEGRNDFPLPTKWRKRPRHRKKIVPENERV